MGVLFGTTTRGLLFKGLLSELLFEGCYSGAAIGAATIFGISGIFGIPAIMPSQLSPQHQKVRIRLSI